MKLAKLIPIVAAIPSYKSFHRPSVEYTGHGNLLCYDSFGGRWFRSSEEAVRLGCNQVIDDFKNEDAYVNYNTIYGYWGIMDSDFGYAWGWAPDEDYTTEIEFEIELIDNPASDMYRKWGEPVLIIAPSQKSPPYDFYMEI